MIPAVLEMHKRFGEHIYAQYGFLDAFNLNFDYDIPVRHGRYIPGFGWVAGDYLGIDQGAILAMIENYRSSMIWDVMRKNPYLRQGLHARGIRRRLAHRLGAIMRACPVFRSAPAASSWLIAASSLVCGCSPHAGSSSTVRFWAMGREGEVVAELVPEFERTHPGIHVEVQQLPWSAAHEKLLTAFAGDSTPDLCQLGNTWIPEFVALNALESLDANVAHSSTIEPSDYFPGIWATNRVEGKLYGVPWYVDTRLLFYRRDLLAQAGHGAPPRSWSEWTSMLASIKQRRVPGQYGIVLPRERVRAAGRIGAATGRRAATRWRSLWQFSKPRLYARF